LPVSFIGRFQRTNFDVRWDDKAPQHWGVLQKVGINLYAQAESGRTFTPIAAGSGDPVGLPNSRNAPAQFTVDLKINRWFKLGTQRYDLSISGSNIFNNYALNVVDPYSGLGPSWGDGQYDPRYFTGFNDFTRVSSVDNPSNYGNGMWKAQLDVDF